MGSRPADGDLAVSRSSDAFRWSHAEPVMGTVVSIHVQVTSASIGRARTAAASVVAELRRLEAMFSTFRPDSAISRLNRGELTIAECPIEVADVLDACTWLAHQSGGAFRIEPPGRPGMVDPAGFVKGWATERAARYLTEAGLDDWYVAVGGDAQTSGCPELGRPWTAAVAAPGTPTAVAMTIEIPPGGAIATSGTAERGDHLWEPSPRPASPRTRDEASPLPTTDPGSGEATGLASMTVVGPRLTWADAFATAAWAMGAQRGVAWVARHTGYRAWALTFSGEVISST